jgi:sulfite exporter TauE/SafE
MVVSELLLPELFGALLVGLMSTPHCMGMCGGLVVAYTLNYADGHRGALFRAHAAYSVGRLGTYALIGALAGWVGGIADLGVRQFARSGWVQLFLGLVMILLAVNLVWPQGITALSRWLRRGGQSTGVGPGRLASFVARIAGPAAGTDRPVLRIMLLGVMTGLLPCGIHWAMQSQAAATGSALHGSLLVTAFGLGTVPGLVMFGVLSRWLTLQTRQWLLRIAGVVVLLMALRTLWMGIALLTGVAGPMGGGHAQHAPAASQHAPAHPAQP